ncbi:hypothetical protein CR513_46637, partial [Mucuna pruriens]
MGEKELMISTPLPTEYVEGDEKALETSFLALEIMGTTNVLISNGFQLGKGLGKELEGMAEPVTLQENPGRYGLSYSRQRGKTRVESLEQEVDTTRPLPLLRQWGHHIPRSNRNDKGPTPEASRMGLPHESGVGQLDDRNSTRIGSPENSHSFIQFESHLKIPFSLSFKKRVKNISINIETTLQIDNMTLGPVNANESCGQDEGEGLEEEALVAQKAVRARKTETPIRSRGAGNDQPRRRRNKKDPGREANGTKPETKTSLHGHTETCRVWIAPLWNTSYPYSPMQSRSEYPQLVANIVPVPEKDRKVRMCVDYRDLNKASPKDNFPTPY